MNNLGSTYYDQHDLDLALSYNEQSLAIREKRNDPVELASSVLNIGVVYEAMGNTAKAAGYFERALQLTTLPDLTPIRIRALYNLGNLLFRSNQYRRRQRETRGDHQTGRRASPIISTPTTPASSWARSPTTKAGMRTPNNWPAPRSPIPGSPANGRRWSPPSICWA